jgi:diguanylate cyclase (GGDEF)-like protein/PAS domain S-box-containing protein
MYRLPKSGTKRRLYSAFVIFLCLMAIVSGVIFIYLQLIKGYSDIEDHAHEAISNANAANTTIIDMQGALRGYLITGVNSYLEPFNQGQEDISNLIADGVEVDRDNFNQILRWKEVSDLHFNWIEKTARPTILARKNIAKGLSQNKFIYPISSMLIESESEKTISALRSTLSKIINFEKEILLSVSNKKNKTVAFAGLFTIFGTLLAILIGALIAKKLSKRIVAAERESLILNGAVKSSPSAVIIFSTSGNVEYINLRFTTVFGFSQDDLLSYKFDILRERDANPFNNNQITRSLENYDLWQGQLLMSRKDGSNFWSKTVLSVIKDEEGKPTHIVGTYENISKEVELNQRLSYQASHDSLTGLYNRFEFERRLKLLLTGTWRLGGEASLFFFDLDEFKVVNDTCGHAAGDELLCEVSKIFKSCVREADIVARIGGDEFAVLLMNCTIEQSQSVASKILERIRKYSLHWENKKYKIGISIGVAPIYSNEYTFTELIKQADTACYLAKSRGKNQIYNYLHNDPESIRIEGDIRWINRISSAIDEDRMMLYAQPILCLKTNVIISYELLLRMVSKQGNIILPGEFLPAAERYNMIQVIDKWVIDHVFKLLNNRPTLMTEDYTLSINLSGASINDSLCDYLVENLSNAKFNPSCICFEITETTAISDFDRANTFISSLKKLGCKFSLDDFGSGFSTFSYLKELDIDFLKIDGSFVKEIHINTVDIAMVKSIHQIAKVMNIKTIAEYVENQEIIKILNNIGIDCAQGYCIGKPEPLCLIL